MNDVEHIKKCGTKALGKTDYLAYRETRKALTARKAILANCYQCTGYYADGKTDCKMPDCPLYPYMPYRMIEGSTKRKRSAKQAEHTGRLAALRAGRPRI